MVIVASDSGNPEKTTAVEAFITVIRDQGAPFFVNTPYRTAINERIETGFNVLVVTARDLDLIVSSPAALGLWLLLLLLSSLLLFTVFASHLDLIVSSPAALGLWLLLLSSLLS